MHCSTGMPQTSHLPSLLVSISCLASCLSKFVKDILDIIAGVCVPVCLISFLLLNKSIAEGIEYIKSPVAVMSSDTNKIFVKSIVAFRYKFFINKPPYAKNCQSSPNNPKNIVELLDLLKWDACNYQA